MLVATTRSGEVSTLSLATIPSNINSYERLAAWVIQALQSANSGLTVKVVEGQPSPPVAQVQLATMADGSLRFVLQAYIEVDEAELNSGSEKTWMAAQDISTAAPNVTYGSN